MPFSGQFSQHTRTMAPKRLDRRKRLFTVSRHRVNRLADPALTEDPQFPTAPTWWPVARGIKSWCVGRCNTQILHAHTSVTNFVLYHCCTAELSSTQKYAFVFARALNASTGGNDCA
ncbi:unnamed protein product, partial [Laminaria digitata]